MDSDTCCRDHTWSEAWLSRRRRSRVWRCRIHDSLALAHCCWYHKQSCRARTHYCRSDCCCHTQVCRQEDTRHTRTLHVLLTLDTWRADYSWAEHKHSPCYILQRAPRSGQNSGGRNPENKTVHFDLIVCHFLKSSIIMRFRKYLKNVGPVLF